MCTYRLDATTVSLSFPTGFFLSYLRDADLNKLYSCLLNEKRLGSEDGIINTITDQLSLMTLPPD